MTTYPCTTCEADVDELADECPKCGAPVRDWRPLPPAPEEREAPINKGRVRWILGVNAAGILGVLLARACEAAGDVDAR